MTTPKGPQRESIWSVARRLRPLFSVILIVQFLAFLGINAFKVATGENPGDVLDIITGAYEKTSSQAFSILLTTYTLTEVMMLASWLRERDQERVEKAKEQGRQEGLQEGEETANQRWQDWLERRESAAREGRDFDEPPPASPQNGNGA